MSIRRRTDPAITQRIWDSIKITVHQRNLPTYDRIMRHLARVYAISEQVAQDELNDAMADGLIFLKSVPVKGGIEQESFRLPTEPPNDDGHDWYCCNCHRAGEVECCQQCYRVFHSECHEAENSEKKLCIFCEQINSDVYNDKTDVNKILGYMCGHLKAKLPAEITNRQILDDETPPVAPPGGFAGPTWISEGEDAWRPGILIKNHIDLAMMDSKTQQKGYKNLAEFQAEAHNILHNIIIYHGEQSIVGEMGLRMYEDCCYDLQEIRRCSDCYRLSNEKGDKMWFCKPCDPPHKLVYAKQKGYPYWPAKIMQIKNDIYDVRFFGGQHLRANIEKSFIRPINVNLKSLQIKRSVAWTKAYDELKHHQALLQKLGKHKSSNSLDDDGELRIVKIRKIDKLSTKDSKNSPLKKQVLKDLRVKVERLNKEGSSDQSEKEEKGDTSKKRPTSVEVPNLPVAEDEPAREISSSCPQGLKKEGSQEDMVTSSSQEPRTKCVLIQTEQIQADVVPAKLKRERRTSDQPVTSVVDKLREDLRQELEREKCRDMENLQAEHARQLQQLKDRHQQLVSEIKKKQWCYNCEAEAIYHCCWNTAYCSTDCQQVHWQREHKRICRRKR